MYLKSLEVHGFKSFANKLVFEFHNGITAIVGPNGSGKSNVSDAVRWVLGEQSAKQLRGAKMEDVIFAGTQMRKPQGYAYVAITINNEDHKLNVPYEEVKIARRVYRSGESEYLLNGASCRLKDVQELLFDTGIGKEGYSIIGQGQIDKILSGKPEERRELFDEAAGIVKYKKRKATAEKNLAEEQQNMVRIEDILSELEKQVEPLERQSGKAKEYLKYRDELRSLDVNMFLAEYDRIHGEVEDLDKKQVIAASDLEKTSQEFEQTKEEYVRVESVLEEHNQSLEVSKDKLTALKVQLNQYEGDIKLVQEQIQTARKDEAHYKERVDGMESSLTKAKEQKEHLQKEKEALDQQLNELLQKQLESNGEITGQNEKISHLEQQIAACNNEIMESLNAASEVKTEQQKYQTLLEQTNLKRAELTQRVLKNKSEAAQIQEAMDLQKQNLLDIADKIEGLDAIRSEIQDNLLQLKAKGNELEKEHVDIQQKFHMENSRLNSLKNMTERYEGFGQSIRRVMEQKKNYPGIIGVVADIIRVKKDYEIAIETALGGSIQNIVTDNEKTAKAMIQHLKQNRYGRATFLPLTNISAKAAARAKNVLSEPGVIGLGSTLVEADPKFESLVEYLLGRFIVVDHIDNAIALAKKYHHTIRIVTKEGELLNPGGSMSGGAYKNNNNLLGRRREMDDLEERVDSLKSRLKEIAGEMEANRRQRQEQQKQSEDNNRIRQEVVLKQNTAKLSYDRAQADHVKNQEELDKIHLDSTGIDSRKEELKKALEELDTQIQDGESQSKTREERIAQLNEELEQMRQIAQNMQNQANEILMDINGQRQRGEFTKTNIQRIQEEMEQLTLEMTQLQENSTHAGQQMQVKEEEIQELQHKIVDTKETIATLETRIVEENEKKEELTKQHKGFFEKRESLSSQMSALDKEVFRLTSQKEKLNERIDSYTNYMWEEYELTYHVAEELKTDMELSLTDMKQQISALKSQIKNLGDVNVNAIEQYKDVMDRYTLLKGQHDDLIKAADVLQGIIEELDAEMRKQFESQFAEIRIRFDKVFKELFGGGRGTLELMEDEDILTAGIKVVAQPPGKKLQNMMQLSGGEKALTAIALLFAIQSLKPSPFCLLDEIEAALDDSNVDRYAEYLHKLTKDTQFIVITHRRGTMNAADILYGITMQEKGVSTLVSVNLLDEKEIAN